MILAVRGAGVYQKVSSVVELKSTLGSISGAFVFRGQTRHYSDDDGRTSMPTSFDRKGCIPPFMLKWMQYADSVIRALQGPGPPAPSDARTQAILQHYGWRSFYIDATNNPAIAAWFAYHQFSSEIRTDLCEDAFGEALALLSLAANYSLSQEESGHLYVISKSEIIRGGHGCDDLGKEIRTEPGLQLRFLAQEACMLGPFQEALPESCIVNHIEAPVSVLAEYAHGEGFDGTSTLFPPPAVDPILKLLLVIPWIRGSVDIVMPTFVQGLELPMYSTDYVKHLPPAVALYSEKWVDHPEFARQIADLVTALFVRVPEAFAYGHPTGQTSFPRVTNLLRRHGTVVIEFNGLFRYAERSREPVYNKGVVLTLVEECVSVCALTVHHPGMRLTGSGAELGWHYSISLSGTWTRMPRSSDCPCNAPHRHEQHFCLIERVEDELASNPGKMIGPLSMELSTA